MHDKINEETTKGKIAITEAADMTRFTCGVIGFLPLAIEFKAKGLNKVFLGWRLMKKRRPDYSGNEGNYAYFRVQMTDTANC